MLMVDLPWKLGKIMGEKEDIYQTQETSAKIREFFAWSGEICTFQTKSVIFLNFLNIWNFVLLWNFNMCTWNLIL